MKSLAWTVLDRSPVSARLGVRVAEGYPWPFAFIVRHEVDGTSVRTELDATNLGNSPAPAGLGFHPYFHRRLWAEEGVTLRANLAGRYPADRQIPRAPAGDDAICGRIRSGCPAASLDLDDVFLGSLDGAALEWPVSGVRATIACSPELSHTVVYTGHPTAVCVEPVSMVNDGFNRMDWPSAGVAILAPGETLRCWWTIRVELPA